jgi:hypothetical protein
MLGDYPSPNHKMGLWNGPAQPGPVGWADPLVMFSLNSKFLCGQRDLLEIAKFLFGQMSTYSEGNECQAFRTTWCLEVHSYTEHTWQAITKHPRWKISSFIKIFEHLLDMRLDCQIISEYRVDRSVMRRSTGRLIIPKGQNTINDR